MGFKSLVFWLLLVVTIGSVGWRAMLAPSGPQLTGGVREHGREHAEGLSPDVTLPPDAALPPPPEVAPGEESRLAALLPSVSEAAAFGFGAFCLAYGSQRSLRHALLLLLLAAVGVWGLGRLEVLSVDWTRAGQLIRDYVLNTSSDGSISAILLDRVPTVATVVIAYACGYRRG